MRTLIKAVVRIVIALMAWGWFLSLVQTIFSFANFISHPEYGTGLGQYLFMSAALILLIGGAVLLVLLWRNTDWLVGVLAGNIDEKQLVINTTNLDLITVVLRILGISLIFTALPALAGHIVNQAIITNGPFQVAPDVQARAVESMITTGGTILIGVWLLYGGKGIAAEVDRQVNRTGKSNAEDHEV
ncbi:MAG: hypothetical protein EHM12_01175 [Dehalococcoidia bacterium]|nr:MAG: hypothetical protein EHM12_01175 [Dehalococcoidia bacterium]